MFIKTEWIGGWIALISFLATLTDLKQRKIFNWITLPALTIGLVASLFAGGASGFMHGLLGAGLAFLAFGWMWMIGMLGAGDVKLLMAYGTLAGAVSATGRSGTEFVVDIALLTIFVGGAIAGVLLALKGGLKPFLSKIYLFFVTATNKNLATEFPKADPAQKMPFGIAIAIAACWVWFDNPIVKWGLRPW